MLIATLWTLSSQALLKPYMAKFPWPWIGDLSLKTRQINYPND